DNIARWMDFFKERSFSDDVPDYMHKALELTLEQDLSYEERQMIDRRLMAEADRLGQLDYAMKEGIKQGVEQGESKKAHAVARTALAKGLDADTVASITGLDITTIEKLAAEVQ
ncbi:MAG: hypothetical protein FWD45_03125, partial [Coriobacteriia bacterium]|nr:hypothetical protein [Coriobacteriia bacterium]